MKRLIVPAAVVVAAAALAGCGGGGDAVSKEEFESSMGSIGDSIAASFEQLAESAPDASSFDDLSNQLDEVKSELESAAGEIESLEFPEDVADTKEQLQSGVEALSDDVQGLIDAVESGDLGSIQAAAQEFQNLDLSSLTDIQEAIEQIQAAGYDVSGGQ